MTNTYSPYLEVGDDALRDPGHDNILRGTDYQEVLTNFPLGNQILTGLFVHITTKELEANGQTQSESTEKTLFDRIGYASRQDDAAPSVAADPSGPPGITPLDTTTFSISASLEPLSALKNSLANVALLASQLHRESSSVDSLSQAHKRHWPPQILRRL